MWSKSWGNFTQLETVQDYCKMSEKESKRWVKVKSDDVENEVKESEKESHSENNSDVERDE